MKKFFLLAAMAISALSLSAKTIYLHTGGSSYWNQGGAVFYVTSWNTGDDANYVKMTEVIGDIYSAQIDDAHTTVEFSRKESDEGGVWNSTDPLQIPEDKNLFKLTSWYDGQWYVYGEQSIIASGSCGANLTWSLDEIAGVLTITGSGDMWDFSYDGAPWSEYRSYISFVDLPDGLTSIGQYAFHYCAIKSIDLPNTVVVIGSEAFSGCSNLKSIVIPESVTSIKSCAFEYCYNLESVMLPSSLTDIASDAFRECHSLPVENNIRYADNFLVEVVDKTLSSYTIKESTKWIGYEAFQNCHEMKSIIIPKNVIRMGYNVFSYCSSLTSIIWNAKNCQTYADYYYGTFGNIHEQITSFQFGNDVEYIPSGLCAGLSNLSEIIIPQSVTKVGGWAFSGTSFSKVHISDLSSWCAIEFMDITSNPLYQSEGLYVNDEKITDLVIPDDVTKISNYAFAGCSFLKSVEFPAGLTTIGNGAFSNCQELTSIALPDKLTSIGGGAFSECIGLKTISFPNGLKSIGSEALAYCDKLTSVIIPNSVTSLGEEVFYRCEGLKMLVIPNSVTELEENTFVHCMNLTSLSAPAQAFDINEEDWFYHTQKLTNVVVNGGELTDQAIGFIKRSYKTLKSLDMSAATNTTLPDEAVKDCYNIEELILPSNLARVGYMAVAGCKNLKAIDIPASVEEIDQSAFEDCRSIESITFGGKAPESKPGLLLAASNSQLRKIGNWAFYNAHELQHLEIPEGVEEIGDAAFYGCTYLQDLVLPESIQKIGDNCFALCSKLEKITINALTPPIIFARTFYDVSRAIPVYVPEEAVEAYNDASYWQDMNIQAEDAPHGIESVSTTTSATQKLMHNGTLYILRDGKMYNAQGARVE